MWKAVTRILGLDEDPDDEQEDDLFRPRGQRLPIAETSSMEETQKRDMEGIVTSLHSSYGLIDKEIFFTLENVADGIMPQVGDKVRVIAQRQHGMGGWKASKVFPIDNSESWDGPAASISSSNSCNVTDLQLPFIASNINRMHEQFAQEHLARQNDAIKTLQELHAEKGGVEITDMLNFGQMQFGSSSSLQIFIKNTGGDARTLHAIDLPEQSEFGCLFELSPLQLDSSSISINASSKKAQHRLPLMLGFGQTATLTAYCHAKSLGRAQQLIVFEFDEFRIARTAVVAVHDSSQFTLDPRLPYKGSRNTCDRDGSSFAGKDSSWLIPGQRPSRSASSIKLPSRLPQFPVPEQLRTCVLSNGNVTNLIQSLSQALSAENYAARFSGLLHLEEIQQEIDMREFDLQQVSMVPKDEFLALTVQGLSEGRPSLLVGDRVIVTSPEDSRSGPAYEGFIHEVLKDEVLLKFCDDFHNNYRFLPYNVRFTFNRSTLRRCHFAAEFASKLKQNILFPSCLLPKLSQSKLTSHLTANPGSSPSLLQSAPPPSSLMPQKAMATVVASPKDSGGIKRGPPRLAMRSGLSGSATTAIDCHKFYNDTLNVMQKTAVLRILTGQSRPTPYIVFGPPGTGKTVTVVESILQIFHNAPNSRIIACAPSNSAVDLLAERLHESGRLQISDMCRLNAFQRTDENVPASVKPYCVDGDDLRSVSRKRIVLCTCSTAGNFYLLELPNNHFTHVFVDEAGQATEPECMIPIGLVAAADEGQVILAGDPMQLGPVLRSHISKHFGLDVSLLERLSKLPLYERNEAKFANHGNYDPLLVTKLVDNYRSHPALLGLSSRLFYHDELKVRADRALIECLCQWQLLPNKSSFPLIFHGIRGDDVREGNSPSWFNPQEVVQVVRYLQSIVHNDQYRIMYDDVGVITPYRKQVEKIRLLIDKLGMERVKVGSVEEFQGQERLVMLISTVRSSESLIGSSLQYTLGFLSNPKRFNVSITRAHALLVVIGNPHVLAQDLYWCKLLKYCVVNKAYIGCDLPHLEIDSDDQILVETMESGDKHSLVPSDANHVHVGEDTSHVSTEDSSVRTTEHELRQTSEKLSVLREIVETRFEVMEDVNKVSKNDSSIRTNEPEVIGKSDSIITRMTDLVMEKSSSLASSSDTNDANVKDFRVTNHVSKDISFVQTIHNEEIGKNDSAVIVNIGLSVKRNSDSEVSAANCSETVKAFSSESIENINSVIIQINDPSIHTGQLATVDLNKFGTIGSTDSGIVLPNRRGGNENTDGLIVGVATPVAVTVNSDVAAVSSDLTVASDFAAVCSDLTIASDSAAVKTDLPAVISELPAVINDLPIVCADVISALTPSDECTACEMMLVGSSLSSSFVQPVDGETSSETNFQQIPESISSNTKSVADDRHDKNTNYMTVNIIPGQNMLVSELIESRIRDCPNNDEADGHCSYQITKTSPKNVENIIKREAGVDEKNNCERSRAWWKWKNYILVRHMQMDTDIDVRLQAAFDRHFVDSSTTSIWESLRKTSCHWMLMNKDNCKSRSRLGAGRGRGRGIVRQHGGSVECDQNNKDVAMGCGLQNLRMTIGHNRQRNGTGNESDQRSVSATEGTSLSENNTTFEMRGVKQNVKPFMEIDLQNYKTGLGNGQPNLSAGTGIGEENIKTTMRALQDNNSGVESGPQICNTECLPGQQNIKVGIGRGLQNFSSGMGREEWNNNTAVRHSQPNLGILNENTERKERVGKPERLDRGTQVMPGGRAGKQSEASQVVEDHERNRKIIRQMEYYFGDFNMMKDAFLREKIDKDPDGWVNLSIIMTFNRMKALTNNPVVVVNALRQSTSNIVETSIDGRRVRRSPLKLFSVNLETWKLNLKTRSVVIMKYPSSETLDRMQAVFEQYGDIEHIERGIKMMNRVPRSRFMIDYIDLIIFVKPESIRNLVKLRYTVLKRMGLTVEFGNELTDECVDYFCEKRVTCVDKSLLQPVGCGRRRQTAFPVLSSTAAKQPSEIEEHQVPNIKLNHQTAEHQALSIKLNHQTEESIHSYPRGSVTLEEVEAELWGTSGEYRLKPTNVAESLNPDSGSVNDTVADFLSRISPTSSNNIKENPDCYSIKRDQLHQLDATDSCEPNRLQSMPYDSSSIETHGQHKAAYGQDSTGHPLGRFSPRQLATFPAFSPISKSPVYSPTAALSPTSGSSPHAFSPHVQLLGPDPNILNLPREQPFVYAPPPLSMAAAASEVQKSFRFDSQSPGLTATYDNNQSYSGSIVAKNGDLCSAGFQHQDDLYCGRSYGRGYPLVELNQEGSGVYKPPREAKGVSQPDSQGSFDMGDVSPRSFSGMLRQRDSPTSATGGSGSSGANCTSAFVSDFVRGGNSNILMHRDDDIIIESDSEEDEDEDDTGAGTQEVENWT